MFVNEKDGFIAFAKDCLDSNERILLSMGFETLLEKTEARAILRLHDMKTNIQALVPVLDQKNLLILLDILERCSFEAELEATNKLKAKLLGA